MSDVAPLSRPRPVAGGLIIILRVFQAVLAVAAAFLTLGAVLFLLPDGPLSDLVADAGSPRGFALACLASAVTAAAWWFVLRLLIRVVHTVRAGDPFIDANTGRMRAMWIIIAATEVFRMVVNSAVDIVVGGGGTDATLDIRIGTWFLVLVIAALSEAFRQGAAMRADAELTI